MVSFKKRKYQKEFLLGLLSGGKLWEGVVIILRPITAKRKWSFPLRISWVNVIKSAVSCRFGHIYWRNPWRKTSFFVQWIAHEQLKWGREIVQDERKFLGHKIYFNALVLLFSLLYHEKLKNRKERKFICFKCKKLFRFIFPLLNIITIKAIKYIQ